MGIFGRGKSKIQRKLVENAGSRGERDDILKKIERAKESADRLPGGEIWNRNQRRTGPNGPNWHEGEIGSDKER